MKEIKRSGRLDPMNTLIISLFLAAFVIGFYLVYAPQIDRFVSHFFEALTVLLILIPVVIGVLLLGWGLVFWERSRAKARAARAEAQEREKSAAAPIFQILDAGQSALVFDPQSRLIHNTAMDPRQAINQSAAATHQQYLIMFEYWKHQRELAQAQNIRIMRPDQAALPDPEDRPAQPLPDLIRIEDIVRPGQVSIKDIILGATNGGELVRGSLPELSHIAVAGTSRWGKSIFLQVLLYQILLAREKTEIYLSDIGGTSFDDFGLPIADDQESTEQMAAHMTAIIAQRKALFKATGRSMRSLESYNEFAGADLPYVIMFADETTKLFTESPTINQHLQNLVVYAGKYGVMLVLAGQNWTHNVVKTIIRDQFSSRFQFKAEDSSQANILIRGSRADKINHKGRAVASLPGKEVVEMQAPHIDESTILDLRTGSALVAADSGPDGQSVIDQVIVDAYMKGDSLRACVKRLYQLKNGEPWPDGKQIGGPHTNEIKEILARNNVGIDRERGVNSV